MYESVSKHIKGYESITKPIKAALPSSFILIRLLNAIIAPKSVLLKCETAWEAFKQGTIGTIRNEKKQRSKERLT